MQLELVAREPDIVTPVGLTFDQQGRLLVIESHTHFPQKDYTGPGHDRIRLIEDTDRDGRVDRFSNFFEGTSKTMSIATGPDNWIYIATRMRVFRTRDTNGDDRADEQQLIAYLETQGNYPHNGLCGITLDGQGGLYFGFGENLGADYRLMGSDGTTLSGGGEGGNIYHCRLDGTDLKQVATGFWNSFGICVDPMGRVFTVENDPDARPPCRLLHVVNGGDYGYQFRYGRSGKHPLQAWNGELPGTLPMVAGTSEAPSSVIAYHGKLWVTSWGEHRIERFELSPHGASFRARRERVVQGDDQFRPIDFATAPDGSLYFTDWVDRSYNVHGKGRIWRLSWKPGQAPRHQLIPRVTQGENKAARASIVPNLDAFDSEDPFLHSAAVAGLSTRQGQTLEDSSEVLSANQRLGYLESMRRLTPLDPKRRVLVLADALKDRAENVRLYALRWIADEGLLELRDSVDQVIGSNGHSARLFLAAVATRDWLDTGKVERGKIAGELFLIEAARSHPSSEIQAMALRALPPGHSGLDRTTLMALIQGSSYAHPVRHEALRTLALLPDQGMSETPQRIGSSVSFLDQLRADAIAGMELESEGTLAMLERLTEDTSQVVRDTVRRIQSRQTPVEGSRPELRNTEGWLKRLQGEGDRYAGWRVFFSNHAARCANCHRWNGRGADVGPDLSGIGKRMDRRRLLESILQPSREVAPQYVPWTLELENRRILSGLSLGVPGSGPVEQFLGTDGKRFELQRNTIESRRLMTQSIMPDNLVVNLSDDDLRDLLTLLAAE